MTTSVLINVRLPQELRSRFADFCAQQGVSVSEAVRRMIEHAIAIKTVKPDDNIWDVIAKGGGSSQLCLILEQVLEVDRRAFCQRFLQLRPRVA